MLKLRRIEIIGFKSFSDRGEISVNDAGVTAIVGPNGCGKSNVSDAIAWVLGEQSAKSLRGEKMEDVIFNGTRSRAPMGMAEVTITLTQLPNGNGNGRMTTPAEPSAQPPLLSKEGSNGHSPTDSSNGHSPTDSSNGHSPTDSSNGHAAADSSNGHTPADSGNGHAPGDPNDGHARTDSNNGHARADSNNGHGPGGSGNGHPPVGPRDIVVQRRLYRSGESLYLIDGKPCRLRDIQDIFLGTGLGPNSYAIIEQGRVGQLLSSKPTDRRALIEEAAGITKFKAKRKLAESRLEAARLNLSRVNDILAEVDRQRNSLKRQAGKARRYIELRDRMRHVLSAVFSTRAEMLVDQQEKLEISLGLMGSEGRRLEHEIERLNALVHQRRIDVGGEEKKLEQMRDRRSEIELEHEKAIQRVERLQDQIRALEDRKISLASDRDRAVEEIAKNTEEKDNKTVQLIGIDGQKQVVEDDVAQAGSAVSNCADRRNTEERSIESLRQQQFETVGREARLRNEATSRQDTILRISAQIERLQKEESEAREQASVLDQQLAEARDDYARQQTDFSDLKVRLQEAEQSYSKNKVDHAAALKAAAEAKTQEESIRNRLQTIGDLAVQRAYSTESVQQFFNAVRGSDWAPLGIVADFVEVETDYEALVEDFLRWKLQYVVVQDRAQAERAIEVVKNVSKGRLDCLVLNGSSTPEPPIAIEGARPLADVVRFGDPVLHFSEYIRDAYIVDTVDRAWELARQHPQLEFVARTGEMVRGHVVSWGEHEDHGPLSLKREIRELDARMDVAVRQTALLKDEAVRIEDLVRESETLKSRLLLDLQEAEKTMLSTDHRVRSLAADVDRAQQRWRVATGEVGRLAEERGQVEKALLETESALAEAAARKAAIDEEVQARSRRSEELRVEMDDLRYNLSGLQSQLAVLQERRSTVARELNGLVQHAADLERRASQAAAQIEQAQEQQEQTRATIESLEITRGGLAEERNSLDAVIAQTTAALDELRRELHEAEAKWDETRGLLDTWKDRHNALEIERTQVESDLKHLAETCIHELNETIEAVCLKYFEALPPTELEVREAEYRDLRDKLDSMGAVNMMAVEEHQEAEERFTFLNTQRQDLLDSIRDTTQAIDEIDAVCRRQFKEAFEAINAGFKDAFVTLFGGGHGELRLLEGAQETDAGVEIVASPPGKKLQNVLLLSGGEKALTALALLIALFRYKPSPFCVLDEVDAPLDEANVDRFAQMVRAMSATTQFIVITHSKRTMETASQLYGVTMEEPGISKIVSVRLN